MLMLFEFHYTYKTTVSRPRVFRYVKAKRLLNKCSVGFGYPFVKGIHMLMVLTPELRI